jgi:SNF2 family DNA or RNA helicase
VGTKLRIALTGSPFQNSLLELYYMVNWAAPGLLGKGERFRDLFAQPIHDGHAPGAKRKQWRKMEKQLVALKPKMARVMNRFSLLPRPQRGIQPEIYAMFICSCAVH